MRHSHSLVVASLLAAGSAIAFPLAAATGPLSLDEAVSLAEARSPQVAAQRASFRAAETLVGPASQNPDPKLVFGVENVPVEGGDRWSLNADFMTMRRIGVMQDFVRAEKRDARVARAAAEAERETALLEVQRVEVQRDTAVAWLERHYADRSAELVKKLIAETELELSTSSAEIAAGKAMPSQAVSARLMRAQLDDRLQDLQRQSRKATLALARFIGDESQRPMDAPPDLRRLVRKVRALEVDVDRHPQLAQLASMESMAEADLRLAQAATKPDWSVELSYAQRGSAYAPMVSLMVRVDLPIFSADRQQPVARAKSLQLESVRAQNEEMRRRHVAEIQAMFLDWETGKSRLERHRSALVPLADERVRTTLAAYEGGRSDLGAVLEARRSAVEAQLAAINAELELARAWAQLAFLVPDLERP